MLVEKIISGKWRLVEWSNIRAGHEECEEVGYYKSDFENFAEISFRAVAEELGIKYGLIRDILYGRNIKYFQTLAELFREYEYITEDEEEFRNLTRLLVIPCSYESLTTVEQFFNCFEELSLQDKIEIVERFSKLSILTPHNIDGQAGELLKRFSELKQSEKCQVISQMFRIKVNMAGDVRASEL